MFQEYEQLSEKSHFAVVFRLRYLNLAAQNHFYQLKSQQRVSKLVDSWISEILADFDHILILEALDTSLAVMMIKFCWSIDDVVHLRV